MDQDRLAGLDPRHLGLVDPGSNPHAAGVQEPEDRLRLIHRQAFADLQLDASPWAYSVGIDHGAVSRGAHGAIGDHGLDPFEPAALKLRDGFERQQVGADGRDLGLVGLDDAFAGVLLELDEHALGLAERELGLVQGRGVGLGLRPSAETLGGRGARPGHVSPHLVGLELADVDVIAHLLEILRQDPS